MASLDTAKEVTEGSVCDTKAACDKVVPAVDVVVEDAVVAVPTEVTGRVPPEVTMQSNTDKH